MQLKVEYHPKLNLFCAFYENFQHFLQNYMITLKQIVWETKK